MQPLIQSNTPMELESIQDCYQMFVAIAHHIMVNSLPLARLNKLEVFQAVLADASILTSTTFFSPEGLDVDA